MLQGLLELQGFEVFTAGTGTSGLEMVHDEQPDLSFIDIGLPEIDGYEVARRLRADPATEKLLLVALTGYGQESDRELVRQAGFNDHLVKPLSLDELNALLSRYSTT